MISTKNERKYLRYESTCTFFVLIHFIYLIFVYF